LDKHRLGATIIVNPKLNRIQQRNFSSFLRLNFRYITMHSLLALLVCTGIAFGRQHGDKCPPRHHCVLQQCERVCEGQSSGAALHGSRARERAMAGIDSSNKIANVEERDGNHDEVIKVDELKLLDAFPLTFFFFFLFFFFVCKCRTVDITHTTTMDRIHHTNSQLAKETKALEQSIQESHSTFTEHTDQYCLPKGLKDAFQNPANRVLI
jgi:hypothetical protein